MSVTFLGTWDAPSYLFSGSLHSSGEKQEKKKKNVSMTNQKIYSISEVATALGEKLKATGEELVSVGAGLAAGRLLQADQRCDRFLLSLC